MLRRVHVAVLELAGGIVQCRGSVWKWVFAAALLACGPADADGPTETLSRFLETMDRSNLNESARKDAYAMLDDTAQAALAERARRAALVTGRKFAPWDMLAPGRFRLRFAPADRAGMRATVTGDHAVVHVTAEDGKERASVPMTRQGGRWRVQLAVPSARRESSSALPPRGSSVVGAASEAEAGATAGLPTAAPRVNEP